MTDTKVSRVKPMPDFFIGGHLKVHGKEHKLHGPCFATFWDLSSYGLGMTKRHKKRFEAQQMVTQLHALAHNTMVWARQWLSPYVPRVRSWGIMRMVRDVFHVSGTIVFDHRQSISQIILNPADPFAKGLAPGLFALLGSEFIVVNLGKT